MLAVTLLTANNILMAAVSQLLYIKMKFLSIIIFIPSILKQSQHITSGSFTVIKGYNWSNSNKETSS